MMAKQPRKPKGIWGNRQDWWIKYANKNISKAVVPLIMSRYYSWLKQRQTTMHSNTPGKQEGKQGNKSDITMSSMVATMSTINSQTASSMGDMAATINSKGKGKIYEATHWCQGTQCKQGKQRKSKALMSLYTGKQSKIKCKQKP